ncbi:hypothetical protein QBC34DRAFT_91806 [Podospora aff. communis PSN243]|uniref:Uncharacterized protein n=1 Tax=Podospora aff. communis PSN243 TaxID=3040156 RepID=A0AAV9GL06_9PEZI|nr:hypothetical protein QBC34DRAFT_91806 [Podospora aff. communis PSN243]
MQTGALAGPVLPACGFLTLTWSRSIVALVDLKRDRHHAWWVGRVGWGCEWYALCGSPFPFQRPGERRDKSSWCGFTYPPHGLPLSPPSCLPSHIGRSVDLDVRSLLLPLHRFCFFWDSTLGYLSYPFPSFSASASLPPAPAPAPTPPRETAKCLARTSSCTTQVPETTKTGLS